MGVSTAGLCALVFVLKRIVSHVETMMALVHEEVERSYKEVAGWKNRKVEETSHQSSGQTPQRESEAFPVQIEADSYSGLWR